MRSIRTAVLPEPALLRKYQQQGAFTDCYACDIELGVTHAQFVAAFYTTWIFKVERLLIAWLLRMKSTDNEAIALAEGRRARFSAWSVEGRTERQLLMCDFRGHTRSWLMTEPLDSGRTRLFFGSAVMPVTDPATGKSGLSAGYRSLMGFHALYSKILLATARSRLATQDATRR